MVVLLLGQCLEAGMVLVPVVGSLAENTPVAAGIAAAAHILVAVERIAAALAAVVPHTARF